MSCSSGDRNPVELLAEEFLERHRRGELPSLSEYVDRHPEWGEEIREVFPALMLMERLKPAAGDVTGTFLSGGQAKSGRVPERLGDFRILREVGRGGMGIVYEAEQESLGRHVALKVLPSHALLNPRHLQRFLREARSAARLHHTNIVPVFGVGEVDGLHYYVMQFIAGSGVHEVVDELRRLKISGRPATDPKPGPTRGGNLPEVTQGFLTGRFAGPPATLPGDSDGGPAAPPAAPPTPDSRPGSEILSGSGLNFAKAVARVGLQVAEALGYAHGQGVLHRDIKPANLLLDVQGTAWVADFGLAKASDDDDLSEVGDILGTLRYMAPERFHGKADARSDLYALGLTLYELLTLRHAFDQTDRDRLILQVTTEAPPRPRSINPDIPRDLETIVLKAMEHDPGRRYQHAGAMADDLERFLADRPIQARSVGALERAWKWARRKPAVAGLMAALAASLLAGFVGVAWQWRQAVAARDDARASASKARTNFAHALETVNTFCTQVSEEQLLDQPGMQPLRRRLLGLALKYYETFQRQEGDSRTLRRELAEAGMRSGIIINELGDTVGSQIALIHARNILEALIRENPKDPTLRLLLVRCYIEIEDADRMSGLGVNNTRMQITYEFIGVPIMERLVAGDPENPEYLRLLGRSYHISTLNQFRIGRYTSAASRSDRAVVTLERVCKAAPEDHEAARWLALAYSDLALEDNPLGRHADTVSALGRAMAIFESLERRFPASRRHRLDRSQCLVQLALAQIGLGRYAEATASLGNAHERLSRLYQEDPDAVEVRYWLAVSKRCLGQVALARGRGAAVPLLREAVALQERVPSGTLSGRDLIALAWSYLWLARAELQFGHDAEVRTARARLRSTLDAITEQSLVGFPLPGQWRDLAQIDALLGPIDLSDPKATAAERIAAGRRQVQDCQARADKLPANTTLRFQAAWGRVLLAELLCREGQEAEARAVITLALPPLEELAGAAPANPLWKHGLARLLEVQARVDARSARPAEARAAAGRAVAIVEALAGSDTAYLYDLACVLNARATAFASEADASAAVAALRRAIANGFDNDHMLNTDPRLDGLRSRPDFPAPVGSSQAK